jgi:hypothetical protein
MLYTKNGEEQMIQLVKEFLLHQEDDDFSSQIHRFAVVLKDKSAKR